MKLHIHLIQPSFRQLALRWFVGPKITYEHYITKERATCPLCHA